MLLGKWQTGGEWGWVSGWLEDVGLEQKHIILYSSVNPHEEALEGAFNDCPDYYYYLNVCVNMFLNDKKGWKSRIGKEVKNSIIWFILLKVIKFPSRLFCCKCWSSHISYERFQQKFSIWLTSYCWAGVEEWFILRLILLLFIRKSHHRASDILYLFHIMFFVALLSSTFLWINTNNYKHFLWI